MADISLTASMRSNLLSLQQTQSLMDMTQERLSTGKKVNSAIDSPSAYYAAQSLSNRAGDLSALLDSMGQAVQTIKAADEGIKTITDFAEQAKAVANSARDTIAKDSAGRVTIGSDIATTAATGDKISIKITAKDGTETTKDLEIASGTSNDDILDKIATAIGGETGVASATKNNSGIDIVATDGYKVEITGGTGAFAGKVNGSAASAGMDTTRENYSKQFNNILAQLDLVSKDSGYKGVNLLQDNDLTVIFNEDRSSSLVVEGSQIDSAGLGLTAAAWSTDASIDASIAQVEDAINQLRTFASELGNNYSIVQSRESFTESLINVLEEGADKLTLADMNEESANMLALQTRQQLAINSLSLASQANQSVLKLF